MNENNFQNHFRAELKRLNFKRKDVCQILDCTMPTLKARIDSPGTFNLNEISKLENVGFNLRVLL